ncbi:hypothetical protein Tco_1077961 [Tanacetum coccineum]
MVPRLQDRDCCYGGHLENDIVSLKSDLAFFKSSRKLQSITLSMEVDAFYFVRAGNDAILVGVETSRAELEIAKARARLV